MHIGYNKVFGTYVVNEREILIKYVPLLMFHLRKNGVLPELINIDVFFEENIFDLNLCFIFYPVRS